MKFGPWINHNGKPVPHLAGKPLRVHLLHSNGETEVCPCKVTKGRGSSWLWRGGYSKVIGYQIGKPNDNQQAERKQEETA